MRFLVDVGVGKAVESWLAHNGYDVLAIRDIDTRLPDHKILSLAVEQSRTIITMDKDFGELVFQSGLSHSGVLLLRMDDADSSAKVEAIREIVDENGDMLSGRFNVYRSGKLRIRE